MQPRSIGVLIFLLATLLPHRFGWAETDTSTLSVTQTATHGKVRTEVELDPYNRSVCVLPKSPLRPGVITMSLEGQTWGGWADLCEKLVKYLRADKLPYDAAVAEGSAHLLASTGYFAEVHCTTTSSATELDCAMSPELIVRDVDIEGHIPFVMLKEDVRRQLFLRPGKLLQHGKEQLDEQAGRIRTYFERQGYFGSKVTVRPEEMGGGAEPNIAMKLHTEIEPGESAITRHITVIGEADVTNDEIDSIFYHNWIFSAFPKRFTPEQFEQDLDEFTKLIQKKNYPDAHVDGTFHVDSKERRVEIELRVRQGPKLVLHFEGNRKLSADDLRDVSTFIKNGSSDVVEVENTRKKIIEAYQKEGYFGVQVTNKVGRSRLDRKVRDVTFVIEEGGTAEVTRVTFEGNLHFPQEQLEKEAKIKTKSSGFLSTGRWIDELIARDQKALLGFYHLHGFAEPQVSVDRDIIADGQLEVKFRIDEGPERKVSSVLIEGAPDSLDQKEMRKHLKLVDGAPYVQSKLASDRRALLQLLAGKGYPRAEVARRMKLPYKTDAGLVEIAYSINPGPRSVLGGVMVRGNFRTSDSVIKDELSFSVGDPLDLMAISDGKQRLRQLGVFSSIELAPLDTWKTSTQTWLLADVQERDQRSADAVIGFRTDELFSVGADARDNDFLGRAVRLDVSARLSNADQVATDARIGRADRLTGKLTAPHPLGLPFNMQYSGTYTYEDKPRYKLRETAATLTAYRTLLSKTACDLCPNLVGAMVYRLSSSSLQIPLLDTNGPMAAQNEMVVINGLLDIPNQKIGRIGPKVTFEHTDSPVDPRSGYNGDLALELAHPDLSGFSGAAPFWRFLASTDVFIPLGIPAKKELSETTILGGPVVLAVGLRYGLGHPIRSHEPMPLTETFAYGGDLSVRGIEEKASTVAFFGANYLLTSATELRWYFLQTSVGAFQLAALTDTGMAAYHIRYLMRSPTVSVGGAFRFVTPVGPLSIAYAVPVVRPEEILARDASALPGSGRIHFAFGYTF